MSDKWSIRGIDAALRKQVYDLAAARGLTIGEAVNQALRLWLDAPDAPPAGMSTTMADLAQRLAAVEAALAARPAPIPRTPRPSHPTGFDHALVERARALKAEGLSNIRVAETMTAEGTKVSPSWVQKVVHK